MSLQLFRPVRTVLVPIFIGISALSVSLSSCAQDLKTIRERGTLVVAVKDNLRPLGFRDQQSNLQGFEIEIAQRLAQELLGSSTAVVLKPVTNQERLTSVLEGTVDLAIARVSATDGRRRIVSFSIPYYLDSTALVTRDANLSLSNLGDRPVAVLNNSTTVETLRYRLRGATLIGVDSYEEAKAFLDRGEAIAFAADASVLSGWVQEFPQYRLLSDSLSVEPLCIVLAKGLKSDELRRQINFILNRWQTEGWLRERADYWGLR